MSIKRSTLESKWYYRVAKVIFVWVPPILVVATVILLVTAGRSGSSSIFYLVTGLVLYFLILKGIWRGLLYVVFGGLDDDSVAKKAVGVAQTVNSSPASALNPADRKQIVEWILMLIAVGCIYYVYFIYKSPPPIHINGGGNGKSAQCISTGCGSNWLCNGNYYSDGVRKSVNACYSSKTQATTLPSWSGTCRQCP